jgi:type IV pilus assembly protein PilO
MSPQDVFFKLTRLHRAAIVVAVGVLLLVAFYFFVVSQIRTEIAVIDKQIGRLKIQIMNEEKVLAQGPRLKKKISALKARLQKMVYSLPQKQEIEGLLKKITDLLSESNLVAKRFVPGKERKNMKLQYATIPISLSVRGNYFKQGAFLASLRELPRIVNVPSITLRKSGNVGGREGQLNKRLDVISLDGSITAVTYRRLSPAEVKAYAARHQKKGAKARAPRRRKR